MADQPNNPSQDEDSTKKETIRITLPPKAEQPAVKRETVRINVPGSSAPAPVGQVPKKETSKIPVSSTTPPTAPVPPPSAPAAPAGTVTKPLSGPSAPPAPSGVATKPLGSGTPPPKPPPLTGRPTIPLKPAAPVAAAGSGVRPPPPPAPGQSGVTAPPIKPASPKKETARISLPSDTPKSAPALPKATVKMQQTQPLSKSPAPAISSANVHSAMDSSPAKPDTAGLVLSIVGFLASGAALFFVYQIFEASKPV